MVIYSIKKAEIRYGLHFFSIENAEIKNGREFIPLIKVKQGTAGDYFHWIYWNKVQLGIYTIENYEIRYG